MGVAQPLRCHAPRKRAMTKKVVSFIRAAAQRPCRHVLKAKTPAGAIPAGVLM